jgi:hypothetical protein
VSTVDAGLLGSERYSINEGAVLVCELCGKPIAPTPMMDRIGELLGEVRRHHVVPVTPMPQLPRSDMSRATAEVTPPSRLNS